MTKGNVDTKIVTEPERFTDGLIDRKHGFLTSLHHTAGHVYSKYLIMSNQIDF